MYLPTFHINLISIKRLCESTNCQLSFEADSCVIQEKKTLRRISLAREIDALYYLEVDKVPKDTGYKFSIE